MLRTFSPIASAWRQTLVRTRAQALAAVEFSFYPAYIETVWNLRNANRVPTRATRSIDDPFEEEKILLDDTVPLDGASMFVNVSLIPAKQAEHYHMHVQVAAPRIIARNGHVILQWDHHEYSVPLRVGEMFFEDISPPDFSRLNKNLPSRRLRLRIEFDTRGKNGKH